MAKIKTASPKGKKLHDKRENSSQAVIGHGKNNLRLLKDHADAC